MTDAATDEELLLEVLNSTPVVGGVPVDRLGDAAAARARLAALGGTGTAEELETVLRVRALLQGVVRGHSDPAVVAPELRDVARVPHVVDGRVEWAMSVGADRALAVRAILAWSRLAEPERPRLRPCANPDCRRFLIDHSRPNAARWCSMAVCGNRMKARRHYGRTRTGSTS